MRLRKLGLQGVTRYARKVEVDFDAIGPGVIAIAGPNGAGKTTLLECAGPGVLFRELPTRSPSTLQSWCGDAGAQVQLAFEMGGQEYDATLTVDGKGNTTGSIDRDGVPLVSGKVREYDSFMTSLMGSKAAFYTSAFGAQGGRGRFAALGVADRKAVFRYYLGLGRIEAAHAKAKDKLKALPSPEWLATVDAKALTAADVIKERKAAIEGLEARVVAWAASTKHLRAELAEMRDLESLRAVVESYDAELDRVADLEDELAELVDAPPPDPGPAPNVEAAEKRLNEVHAAVALATRKRAEVAGMDARLAEARRSAADATKRAAVLKRVPCEGRLDGCEFLAEAADAAQAEAPPKRHGLANEGGGAPRAGVDCAADGLAKHLARFRPAATGEGTATPTVLAATGSGAAATGSSGRDSSGAGFSGRCAGVVVRPPAGTAFASSLGTTATTPTFG